MTLDYCGNKYLMTKRTVKGEISTAVKCSQSLSENIMTGYISYQLTNHTPLSTMFCFTIHVRNLMRNIFSSYFSSYFQKFEYVFFVWLYKKRNYLIDLTLWNLFIERQWYYSKSTNSMLILYCVCVVMTMCVRIPQIHSLLIRCKCMNSL